MESSSSDDDENYEIANLEVERKYGGKDENYIAKVVNLRELVYEELRSAEESMEAAQRTLSQIQFQMTNLRVKLESTTGRTRHIAGQEIVSESILDLGEEDRLQRLQKEVRTLRYMIPYSLVFPRPSKSDQIRLSNDPNVVWHPRVPTGTCRDRTYIAETNWENINYRVYVCNPNFYVLRHPDAPGYPSSGASYELVRCLKEFPRDVIIKRTLLLNCFRAHSESDSSSSSSEFDDAINDLVSKGLLETICKKSTFTVSSYWAGNSLQSYSPSTFIHFSPLPSEEHAVLYSNNRPILGKMKSLQVLLLGKWHRSLPLSQHIEVSDPDLFYKGMENLTQVKYISFQGISMIPELPQFITKLKKLQTLDCKSCHNLEGIPKDINKLWRTLTHLDISDCHLLDHMPPSLSDLINLEVLKGFHVGEPNHQRRSCTLRNLTKLSKLKKLHISTSVKGFPNFDQLTDLQKFPSLRNLGISWRACQTPSESSTLLTKTARGVITRIDSTGSDQLLSFQLEKLDLQCVPNTVTRAWLNPVVFKGLKRLYITGGKFSDLGQALDGLEEDCTPKAAKEEQWTVEILRLRHMSEMKMDKSELDNLFPELIHLEKVDCPNFTSCYEYNGFWLKSTHPLLCFKKEIRTDPKEEKDLIDLIEKEHRRDRTSFCYDHNGIWLKSTYLPPAPPFTFNPYHIFCQRSM